MHENDHEVPERVPADALEGTPEAAPVPEPEGLEAEGGRLEAEGGRRKAEGGRLKAEGGSLEAEGGSLEAEGGRLEAEGGRRKAEGGRLKAEGGSLEAEGGSLEAEGGSLEAEGGSLEAEGGSLEAEGGRLKAEGGRRKAEGEGLEAEGGTVSLADATEAAGEVVTATEAGGSSEAAGEGGSGVEGRQAEEFAVEMQAEPHNVDGEAGEATPEALAAAGESAYEPDRPAASAGTSSDGPGEGARRAEEIANDLEVEPHSVEGERDDATLGARVPADDLTEDAAASADTTSEESGVEERQAEDFAAAMNAEPHNIDGEAGEATPEELAGAEESGHVDGVPTASPDSLSADEILAPDEGRQQQSIWPSEDTELTAMLEAVIYITDEPLTLEQMASALEQPRDRIKRLLEELVAEWQKPHHGLSIREVAGGYKMATKAEHHDAVRQFVRNLKPPMKLSLPALETLAVIAYKQPVTAPEIMEIRGVQGAGVLKTLIDRKLVSPAGRKNVIGKPILYKTTKEFLVQFGLKDLSELPSVKEFEELARFATPEPESAPAAAAPPPPAEASSRQSAEAEASPEGEPQPPEPGTE